MPSKNLKTEVQTKSTKEKLYEKVLVIQVVLLLVKIIVKMIP